MKKQQTKNNIKWKLIILAFFVLYVFLVAMSLIPHIVGNAGGLNVVNIAVQMGALIVLVVSLAVYIYFFDTETMEQPRKIVMVNATMILSYGLIMLLSGVWEYGLYLAPFAFCTIVIALLSSGKSGFFANFVVIMVYFMQAINFGSGVASEELFYLLFAGIITAVYASYMMGRHYQRLRYLLVGILLGAIATLCSAISFLMFYNVNDPFSLSEFGIKLGASFASGILGVTLMFIVVPVFERMFNVVSVFRFSEIANGNTPLMRQMFEKAPGTYNHSLSVAIYVEACAVAIGESAMLARAAAYYHDIGKMKNPTYFTENQLNGVNPHNGMTPEASVNMIKSHTTNGLILAKEYKLPVEVQNAIVEHHGTMPIKYFYLKAQKYTDGKLPYDNYCYDGPKPTSKISAILMICDSCEAALRAAGDKSKTEKIVDDIVAERMAFDQFSNCDITMKEIDIIKSTIITTFLGIRHKRVKYPDVQLQGDAK